MPAHTAIARARSAGTSKVLRTIASDAGKKSAAPMPCTKRATTRIATDDATPQAADAATNSASPARYTCFAPNRSDSAPPARISAAKLSVYASTIHASSATVAPRLVRIAGSATLTIVESSTAMNMPTATSASVQRCSRAVGRLGAAAATGTGTERQSDMTPPDRCRKSRTGRAMRKSDNFASV